MNELDRFDRDVAAWLAGGPAGGRERAPEALLGSTLAVTTRTSQRPAIVAILAGAPTMAPRAVTGLSLRAGILVAALVAAMVVTIVAVGSAILERQRRLAVEPSPAPSASVGVETAPPSVGPSPSLVAATGPYLLPGTTAMFSADLPADWRVVGPPEEGGDGYRIVARYELGPTFDPIAIDWLTITASADPLAAVRSEMLASGWTTVERIAVPGLVGEILSGPAAGTLDPTALVVANGFTYRLAAHDLEAPGQGRWVLEVFLPRFIPLGAPSAGDVYRDEAWRFAFSNGATGGRFLAPIELPGGITRFPDQACKADPTTCAMFVDVVRLPNASPLHLTLPDGRSVALRIDPRSDEYVVLAQEWEAKVGVSRGSMAVYWQGPVIYNVDNVELDAWFVHRGDQWLVMLASERFSGDDRRLDAFLAGMSLLP